MEYIKKEDLIKGEIYTHQNGNIVKYEFLNLDNQVCGKHIGQNKTRFCSDMIKHQGLFKIKELRLATPEEKYWLKTCIEQDKFITFEEAMKSFIPEYVECVLPEIWKQTIKENNGNLIFKSNFKSSCVLQIKDKLLDKTQSSFKPSIKEAYDAQFVVKEPEFVLPEKWCIKFSKDKELLNWCKKNTQTHFKSFENLYVTENNYFHYPLNTTQVTDKNNDYTEITFEQFKKYVLKEQLEEPKDKVLEKEGIDLNIGKIIKVESSEGAIFELDDKITVFTHDSPNKGKVFTIEGFRWNKAKTSICAITEIHTPNGIGLDKIELYSEPVVKIVEDFKLPETWWITIENERQLEIAKQYFSQHFNNLNVFKVGKTVGYVKNVLDNYAANAFNLLTTTKMNNPQITFEQFEQYVLHNGFKVGDKFNKIKSLLNHTAPYVVNEKEIIDLQYINNESVAFYKVIETNHSGPQCRILTKNIVR